MPDKLKNSDSSTRQGIAAAYTLTGAVIGLGLFGYFLDHKFGTSPAFLLGGLVLGLIVGFYDLGRAMFHKKKKL